MYKSERKALYVTVQHNCQNFELLTTNEQKFIFLMTNEDENVMANLAKFTYKSLQIRDNVVNIKNIDQCFCAKILVNPI